MNLHDVLVIVHTYNGIYCGLAVASWAPVPYFVFFLACLVLDIGISLFLLSCNHDVLLV